MLIRCNVIMYKASNSEGSFFYIIQSSPIDMLSYTIHKKWWIQVLLIFLTHCLPCSQEPLQAWKVITSAAIEHKSQTHVSIDRDNCKVQLNGQLDRLLATLISLFVEPRSQTTSWPGYFCIYGSSDHKQSGNERLVIHIYIFFGTLQFYWRIMLTLMDSKVSDMMLCWLHHFHRFDQI